MSNQTQSAEEIVAEAMKSVFEPRAPLPDLSPSDLIKWCAYIRAWTKDRVRGDDGQLQSMPPDPMPFLTFNDPQLEHMMQVAVRFMMAAKEGKAPRWMSFMGQSNTGKSFLAEAVYRWWKDQPFHQSVRIGEDNYRGAVKVNWTDVSEDLKAGEGRELMKELAVTRLLFLDEIAGYHDTTGFITKQLANLLERRVGKWTIITGNWSMKQCAEVSNRIASRLVRDNCEVVDIDTTQFKLRRRV